MASTTSPTSSLLPLSRSGFLILKFCKGPGVCSLLVSFTTKILTREYGRRTSVRSPRVVGTHQNGRTIENIERRRRILERVRRGGEGTQSALRVETVGVEKGDHTEVELSLDLSPRVGNPGPTLSQNLVIPFFSRHPRTPDSSEPCEDRRLDPHPYSGSSYRDPISTLNGVKVTFRKGCSGLQRSDGLQRIR